MIWVLIYTVLLGITFVVLGIPLVLFMLRQHFKKKRVSSKAEGGSFTVAFFHPYCNAGGGGERVLWGAVRALQTRYPGLKIVVYTGDLDASPEDILGRVRSRLDINLPQPVEFVYLHRRHWVEASLYPYFTMLGQSIGSVILGFEAMSAFLPDIYIDSMGYAFTLPLFSYIGGCSVACYVHYPTVSQDMLWKVARNDRPAVKRSPLLSSAKILYYRLFSWAYGHAGRFSDIVIVNSTWTEDHINSIWNCPLRTHRVYPPCDTTKLKSIQRVDDSLLKEIKIVSIGQFRPEKDHPLQLKSMYHLRQLVSEETWDKIKLILIGSCRHKEDEERVQDMKDLCKHLSLENNVEFCVNISYEEMKEILSSSMIGLHAMWNEHFGIGVVECMAAGLIMVAHRSGGPKMDIIEESEGSRNGYLATYETEYAMAIATIIQLPESTRNKIREAARSSVDRFSVEEFDKGFLRAVEPFFLSKKDE